MEYNQIFRPDTLSKLNKRSQENLKKMMGDKTLMQTMMSSTKLLQEIMAIEAPYKDQLEQLAIQMAEDMYPIILEDNIKLDAKIVSMGDVNKSLYEIKIEKPGIIKFPLLIKNQNDWSRFIEFYAKSFWDNPNFLGKDSYNNFNEFYLKVMNDRYGPRKLNFPFYVIKKDNDFTSRKSLTPDKIKRSTWGNLSNKLKSIPKDQQEELRPIIKNKTGLFESTPESKRRVINGITQGAALHGTFSFYMFKEYLDAIDDTLVEKYNQLMKEVFGVYDDDNAIAMFLQMIAQGQKMGGGSSKVVINEIKIDKPIHVSKLKWGDWSKLLNNSKPDTLKKYGYQNTGLGNFIMKILTPSQKIQLYKELTKQNLQENNQQSPTIQARAICFPMLVHEIIKGLYELVSLQGFQGTKDQNQAVVDKVDKLENEPHDLRYGKFIYDALNDIYAESGYDDSRIREFFFAEVYQLGDQEFVDFVENALNNELTSSQQSWIKQTLKEIQMDLRDDDFDSTGLDEIKINKPFRKLLLTKYKTDRLSTIGLDYPIEGTLTSENAVFEFFMDFEGVNEEEIYNDFKTLLNNNGITDYNETSLYNGAIVVIKIPLKNIQIDRDLDDFDPDNIYEIKINKPGLNFPIKIRSQKQALEIGEKLKKLGYRWVGNEHFDFKGWPFDPFEEFNIISIGSDGSGDLNGEKILDFKLHDLDESKSPCWDDYKKQGTKIKNK